MAGSTTDETAGKVITPAASSVAPSAGSWVDRWSSNCSEISHANDPVAAEAALGAAACAGAVPTRAVAATAPAATIASPRRRLCSDMQFLF